MYRWCRLRLWNYLLIFTRLLDKNEDYNFENLSGTSNLDEVSKVAPSSYFVVNFYVIICNLKAWCFPID